MGETISTAVTVSGIIDTVYELFFVRSSKRSFFMTIIIRKLDKTKHEYLAYTKSLCGKATYFILFEDNILGAVTLHNFIEMLKAFFKQNKAEVVIGDKSLKVKNEMVLDLIRKY